MDESVSRRQFFRGLAGDLLKVVGEVTGLSEEEPQAPRVFNLREGDVAVPPEKQEAALSDLFGFLEQLGVQKQEDGEGEAPADHVERDPALDDPATTAGAPVERYPAQVDPKAPEADDTPA
jgi:hypothetical protein